MSMVKVRAMPYNEFWPPDELIWPYHWPGCARGHETRETNEVELIMWKKNLGCIIMGFLLGTGSMGLLVHNNATNAFKSGNAEAWRDIVTVMNDRKLIQGPLDVNEPNTTVKNCVFISLTPNDYDTPSSSLLEVGAAGSTFINTWFLDVEIMRSIKGCDFPYADFWAPEESELVRVVDHFAVE